MLGQEKGAILKRKALAGEVKKGGRNAYLFSPIDGIVEKVNPELTENSSIIRKSPYGKGWFFIIKPGNIDDSLQKLYFGNEARKWFRNEGKQLFNRLKEEVGALVQDGGEPIEDLFSDMSEEDWKSIAKDFLSM